MYIDYLNFVFNDLQVVNLMEKELQVTTVFLGCEQIGIDIK